MAMKIDPVGTFMCVMHVGHSIIPVNGDVTGAHGACDGEAPSDTDNSQPLSIDGERANKGWLDTAHDADESLITMPHVHHFHHCCVMPDFIVEDFPVDHSLMRETGDDQDVNPMVHDPTLGMGMSCDNCSKGGHTDPMTTYCTSSTITELLMIAHLPINVGTDDSASLAITGLPATNGIDITMLCHDSESLTHETSSHFDQEHMSMGIHEILEVNTLHIVMGTSLVGNVWQHETGGGDSDKTETMSEAGDHTAEGGHSKKVSEEFVDVTVATHLAGDLWTLINPFDPAIMNHLKVDGFMEPNHFDSDVSVCDHFMVMYGSVTRTRDILGNHETDGGTGTFSLTQGLVVGSHLDSTIVLKHLDHVHHNLYANVNIDNCVEGPGLLHSRFGNPGHNNMKSSTDHTDAVGSKHGRDIVHAHTKDRCEKALSLLAHMLRHTFRRQDRQDHTVAKHMRVVLTVVADGDVPDLEMIFHRISNECNVQHQRRLLLDPQHHSCECGLGVQTT